MNGLVLGWLLACAGSSDDGADTGAPPDDTERPDTDTGTEVIDDTGPTDTDTDTDTGEADTGPDDAVAYEAFFDATVVQRVDLELSEEALAALRADPESYVEGVFAHEGYRYEGVGIKLKGGSSTFEDVDGKPSFRVRLDEYDDGKDYGGLDRINLHNMKADPAQAREVLAYALLARAGRVAPRANFAEVYINGASYGLYANVEEVDDAFLARRYADPTGDLWEAGDGADLTPGGVDNYALVAGGGDLAALDAARRQVQTGEGAFYDAADEVLAMDQYLAFWAWQIVLANEDGYPYELDDHALYADPASGGRFEWLPWGLDESFDAGMDWEAYTGTVAVHCAYDDACLALLQGAVREALTTWEGLDADGLASEVFAVSGDAVNADPRRAASASEVLGARSLLLSAVTNRATTVRGQMGI